MKTKNLSTLKVFQFSSRWFKTLFLQSCPEKFIRLLCECTGNRLKRNLQSIKIHQVTTFQNKVYLLFLEQITWKQVRDVVADEKGLQIIKIMTRNSLSSFLLLCITTIVLILRHLHSRSFQSIELNKIPRTKLIRSKRK